MKFLGGGEKRRADVILKFCGQSPGPINQPDNDLLSVKSHDCPLPYVQSQVPDGRMARWEW